MTPVVAAALSNIFLFILIAGMAGTTDITGFRQQLTNVRGIATGVGCQFFLLPFLGFSSVSLFQLNRTFGIMLLLVTSSPGGGFSGWWCSLGNADIALSVAMTTVSTLASVFMLPLNVLLYVQAIYGTNVELNFLGMIISIAIVIGAVITGVVLGTLRPNWKGIFNKMGTVGGVANIAIGAFSSSGSSTPLWEHPASWYIAIGSPCFLGLCLSFAMAYVLRCTGPEAVAICIECCYQNTALAIAVALTIFPPEEAALATGVPIFYGGIEILIIALFTLVAWKSGLTYAPASTPLLKCISGNHQPDGAGRNGVLPHPPSGQTQIMAADEVEVMPRQSTGDDLHAHDKREAASHEDRLDGGTWRGSAAVADGDTAAAPSGPRAAAD